LNTLRCSKLRFLELRRPFCPSSSLSDYDEFASLLDKNPSARKGAF
jgi:hypothetical protein